MKEAFQVISRRHRHHSKYLVGLCKQSLPELGILPRSINDRSNSFVGKNPAEWTKLFTNTCVVSATYN